MDERGRNPKDKARAAPSSTNGPGFQTIGRDETAKLDERIASKMRTKLPTSPGLKPGNEERTRRGAGATLPCEHIASEYSHDDLTGKQNYSKYHSSTTPQLCNLESDVNVMTKSRGVSTPGKAQDFGSEEACQMDTKIPAKTSVRKSKHVTSGMSFASSRSQLQTLESDVAIKHRAGSHGDTFGGSGAAAVASTPGARAELTMMEDEVTAKARGMGSRSESLASSHPGDRETLDDFEYSVTCTSKSHCATSAHVIPSNADSAVVSRLDDRIDAKIRGASVSQVTEDIVEEPDHIDEMDYAQQYKRAAAAGNEKGHMIEESAPPMVSSARGMINEPEVEFGTYGGAGHGYVNEGLAVALAIEEDEEEAFIPAAIEYDPDSKPPIYKNRRVRLYSAMSVVLLVVIVVGVTIGVMTTGGGSEQAPTLAPTTVREGLGIHEQITAVVEFEAINSLDSPQSLAMDWIINKDPANLQPDAPNLIQRYLLALFYISTTQLTPWLSCNPPVGNETSVCLFQKLVQNFPNETYESVSWTRWLSAEHECTWAGVFCDEFNQTRAIELCKCPSFLSNCVESFDALSHLSNISQNAIPSPPLAGQEIRGTLPTDLIKLPYLQSLTLVWNELYGTLPTELATMKHLLNIELHYNFFSGSVPAEWYSSQALQRVNLAGNMLTGQIPSEIGQLSTMKGFFLFENMINGTLPTEIGNMKFLSFSRLARNFIGGTLPSEVGKLAKLQELWVHRNLLTGGIPTEFGSLRDLGDLRVHFNSLTGSLPDAFYNMSQLNRFDAYNCNMTGTISTHVGRMLSLESFRIRENNFEGTIPSELGQIKGLETLWLQLNDIVGSVPNEVCALRGSKFTILASDCRSDDIAVEPLVACLDGCCTICCDTFSGVCLLP